MSMKEEAKAPNGFESAKADADLIANAPTYIAYLLKELDELRAANQWVRVEERLPKIGRVVSILYGERDGQWSHSFAFKHENGEWCDTFIGDFCSEDPIYWLDAPPLPKHPGQEG